MDALIVFSHLRWHAVWQRPQHLLSRAARHYRVLVVEEPVFQKGIAPRMDVSSRPGGITVAGYLFGNIPWVKENLDKIIWAMIILPGLIAIFGAWKGRRRQLA